jgi:tripartite-type tricarboxylate transporter receptor subunit TctC
MKESRGALAFAVLLVLGLSGPAGAQTYPERPIKMIVPTPPGGPIDTMARVVANGLGATLGQSIVIDNRGGAGNTIGSAEAARAAPDGYTLLFSSASGLVISPLLYAHPGYDPVTSFEPIAATTDIPLVLVVNPSVPANSVQELVAYAKAHPGQLNFASGGSGTLPHLAGELLKSMAGIDIVHVPYKGGGPGLTDTVGGQTQIMFDVPATVMPFVKAGKLRLLAVASATRDPFLPDVPTMAESGFPGFQATSWTAILAPAGTPHALAAKLNTAVNRALNSNDVRSTLAKLGSAAIGGPPDTLVQMIADDRARFAPIVRQLHLTAQE